MASADGVRAPPVRARGAVHASEPLSSPRRLRYAARMAHLHQPLTAQELDDLNELLLELRPTEGLELHRAHGLLAAVATAPTLIPPSTWMPALLGDAPSVQDRAQFVAVTGLLFKLYNEINDTLGAGEFYPLDHEDPDALRDWCIGYLEGAELEPLGLTAHERAALVAFLRALSP